MRWFTVCAAMCVMLIGGQALKAELVDETQPELVVDAKAKQMYAWRTPTTNVLHQTPALPPHVKLPAYTPTQGWINWRGPNQNSMTTGGLDSHELAWKKIGLKGRGTPVIHGDRLYAMAYEGEGDELVEMLICLDASTGKEIWRHNFPDFLSDIIYDRYGIGAPAISEDGKTIYVITTPGLVYAFNKTGKVLWKHSLMEDYGRLTFPNGRTGAPVLIHGLAIVHGITSSWGGQGPARDRFFAFNQKTGALVWVSTPGTGPPFLKDSSFSTPIVERRGNRTVFYAGTGCGNVVCVNVDTGEPLWRFQMGIGGVNISPVLVGDHLIATHGKENLDTTEVGRMVALKLPDPKKYEDGDGKSQQLDKSAEVWRAPLAAFTSSPTLGVDAVYQVIATGELVSIHPKTGKENWRLKLSNSQLHACPLNANGILYIPFTSGDMFAVDVRGEKPVVLKKFELGGNALGQPSIYGGYLYVFSTKGLYCFGNGEGAKVKRVSMGPGYLGAAIASKQDQYSANDYLLQILPSTELLLRPGNRLKFQPKIYTLSRGGDGVNPEQVTLSKYIPATAKVKAELDASFEGTTLVVPKDAKLSAGAFKATAGELTATGRGRILPAPPYAFDFEDAKLTVDHKGDGVKFAYPPLPWIGARFKWEIRDVDGTKALRKTLDRVLFQRSTTFIGHSEDQDYTMQADVRIDRHRRIMGEVGVINQRYLVTLKGIQQQIEVNSNHDRLKVALPFKIKPGTWYTLKTRVDVKEDGTGVVRGKAWERGTDEPEAWTIEVPVKMAHRNGSPGFFGFGPQSKVPVYVDNIKVSPNN